MAFSDVEGDRGCGLVEVLDYVRARTARLHFVENRTDPLRLRRYREPIRFELLMIEHAAVIGRSERSVQLIQPRVERLALRLSGADAAQSVSRVVARTRAARAVRAN